MRVTNQCQPGGGDARALRGAYCLPRGISTAGATDAKDIAGKARPTAPLSSKSSSSGFGYFGSVLSSFTDGAVMLSTVTPSMPAAWRAALMAVVQESVSMAPRKSAVSLVT